MYSAPRQEFWYFNDSITGLEDPQGWLKAALEDHLKILFWRQKHRNFLADFNKTEPPLDCLRGQAGSLRILGGTKFLSQTKPYFKLGFNTFTPTRAHRSHTELTQRSQEAPARRPGPLRRWQPGSGSSGRHVRAARASPATPPAALAGPRARHPAEGEGVRDGLAQRQWPPAPQDGAAGVGSGAPVTPRHTGAEKPFTFSSPPLFYIYYY